jgi:predicted metal-dependent hydrolase
MIEYKLIRSNRKTLSLHITADGLEARAPMRMPIAEIERFIAKKAGWIRKHMNSDNAASQGAEFSLTYGDVAPLRGKEYPIAGSVSMNVGKPNHYRGKFDNGKFIIGENLIPGEIRFILSRIYRNEAEKYIPRRVEYFAEIMGLSPENVRITTAFGRWGSCNAKKRLNFAWALMMADDDAIDSVVIHELAHIIHLNHSKDFWAIVKKYCPDYAAQKRKLNDLGRWIASKRFAQKTGL